MIYDLFESAKKHNGVIVTGFWGRYRWISGSKSIDATEIMKIYCNASITH